MFGIQIAAVVLVLALLVAVLAIDTRVDAQREAADVSLAVSRMIATSPAVFEGLADARPTDVLQPIAVDAMNVTGVDFITIMTVDGIRLTHPNPDQIGRPFLGTIGEAQAGRTITETFTGTLGRSVRAVVPILNDAGKPIAIVSAGITMEQIGNAMLPRIPVILVLAAAVIAIGTLAALAALRSVRRVTGDLPPEPLRQMVSFYESVFHSVREGVVITDGDGRVVLYNDEAADLLGLPPSSGEGLRPIAPDELGITSAIAELLAEGGRVVEQTHLGADRVLLVNQEPTGTPGAVMTLRDQSRLTELTGQLDSVRSISEALRSQTHEHANVLHTIVGLLEAGRSDDAIGLIEESTQVSQGLTDRVVGARIEPVLSALLLGKSATAHELGIRLNVAIDDDVELPPLTPTELVSVVGNLLDNAFEAARESSSPAVSFVCTATEQATTIRVSDSGRGPDHPDIFDRGVTTKEGSDRGIGLALVDAVVRRHGGDVTFVPGAVTAVEVRLPNRSVP